MSTLLSRYIESHAYKSRATAITSGGVDKWGRKATLIFGCTAIVISYAIIGALADAYPAETHSNRAAAIVQVIFIYAILMVRP